MPQLARLPFTSTLQVPLALDLRDYLIRLHMIQSRSLTAINSSVDHHRTLINPPFHFVSVSPSPKNWIRSTPSQSQRVTLAWRRVPLILAPCERRPLKVAWTYARPSWGTAKIRGRGAASLLRGPDAFCHLQRVSFRRLRSWWRSPRAHFLLSSEAFSCAIICRFLKLW